MLNAGPWLSWMRDLVRAPRARRSVVIDRHALVLLPELKPCADDRSTAQPTLDGVHPAALSTPPPAPEPTPFPIPKRFQRPKEAEARDDAWLIRRGGEADIPLAVLPVGLQVEGFLAYLGELEEARDLDLSGTDISKGTVFRGAFSHTLAPIYIDFCQEYWVQPHRWDGTGGFAQHLRQRTDRKGKKRYAYTRHDGRDDARLVFFILPNALPRWPKWFLDRVAQLDAASGIVHEQQQQLMAA